MSVSDNGRLNNPLGRPPGAGSRHGRTGLRGRQSDPAAVAEVRRIIGAEAVERTLLFSGVVAHSYGKITDSVVMPQVDIGRYARINNAIIDRGCIIPPGTSIGIDEDSDRERGFRMTEKGRVLVTPEMLNQQIHMTR